MRIIMLGAGGHARSLVDALGNTKVDAVAVPDFEELTTVAMAPEAITESDVLAYSTSAVSLVNGIGQLIPGGVRWEIFERFSTVGFNFASVTHPTAYVSTTATLGRGVQLLARTIIGPYTHIGDNTLINSGAIIDHDCHIGAGVHVAPGVTVSGGVTVGADAMIGAGATIIQGCRVGAGSFVAAGAVVVGDVAPGQLVVGIPARPRPG